MVEKLRGRPESAERRGNAASAETDAAAQARAYLDLWEHHLVYAAVRSRHGPARPPTAPEPPPRA